MKQRNLAPEIPRSLMKFIKATGVLVTNVHFKYNGICYVQLNGLDMGASLVVILEDI